MNSLEEILKAAVSGDGNVQEKIDQATGTYKDAVADDKNTEAKTAYGSLPKAPDPTPFTIGPLGSK